MEAAFVRIGYTNWKDATRNFANHQNTDFHRQAAVALEPSRDVSEMLSSKVASDKATNRQYFLKVLLTIKYLARQGRGVLHCKHRFINPSSYLGFINLCCKFDRRNFEILKKFWHISHFRN